MKNQIKISLLLNLYRFLLQNIANTQLAYRHTDVKTGGIHNLSYGRNTVTLCLSNVMPLIDKTPC